ncbi:hypothetical protein P8625_02055 [Tenacibaculum tangerinum]|uniref:DUF4390 domain-containing protein n=1 Tax=Tenacibaculum tangerinum TaxID=3038772 RepID=A0ABY8L705_9FLAO|nr:hypothetical protein [Tenacibaculum tangerinum]WGH75973.1 hypothetical protein P8625_02055 [Tenacibaculum tangerinum]
MITNYMKRLNLLILGLILTLNSYSQKREKFEVGVQLIENNIPVEFKESKSILFIFDVRGCQANFYTDLRKQIEKRFKKTNKKIGFNFEINTFIEKEKVPTKRNSFKEYDIICQIVLDNFKGWDDNLYKKRKQRYNLVLTIKKNDSDLVQGLATINVKSYWTIATQNKNSSKLIYKLFNN